MVGSEGLSGIVAGLFGRPHGSALSVWQDKDIQFDLCLKDLDCRKGEFLVDKLTGVEDTKANNGDLGMMLITTLRVMWISHRNRRTNISIGYNSITSTNVRTTNSRTRGDSQSMYVLTKFNGSRFEFIFTSLMGTHPRIFDNLQLVHSAYESSKMYRDLKLRANLLRDFELRLLRKEELFHKVQGVWNLSNDQGTPGTFFITNVRVVWNSQHTENFNISIPYIRIKSVRIRESKFGPALVIETVPQGGGYILGFQLDPKDKLEKVHKEISSLWKMYSANPIFGVEFTSLEEPQTKIFNDQALQEDVQIVECEEKGDLFASYFADSANSTDRPIVFCPQLGLAIESLKTGTDIDQFWKVV